MSNINTLNIILHDPDRKPLVTIAKEMVLFCVRNRETPQFYVKSMLYRRDAGDSRAYYSKKEVRKIQLFERDRAVAQYFANKVLFYKHLKEVGLPLPRILGYNVRSQFFSAAGLRSIDTFPEFQSLLRELLGDAHIVFAKPAVGAGGGNVRQITESDLSEEVKLGAFHRRVISTSFVFQEKIRQHPALAEFYSGSVNSMRVMTCRRNGETEVLSAVIRFGARGSFIDNVSSGGVFAAIDLETGILQGPARQYLNQGGGKFEAHPDTGKKFAGFMIPLFEEVKAVAIEASHALPYKLVGWDIAVVEDGPIIIEGNDWPNLDLVQMAYGGYRSHPTFAPYAKMILASTNGRARR